MSTHNICFYEGISKIIPSLSSNKHLILSSDFGSYFMKTYVVDAYKNCLCSKRLNHRVTCPKDANGMTNSADPDQTLGAV